MKSIDVIAVFMFLFFLIAIPICWFISMEMYLMRLAIPALLFAIFPVLGFLVFAIVYSRVKK